MRKDDSQFVVRGAEAGAANHGTTTRRCLFSGALMSLILTAGCGGATRTGHGAPAVLWQLSVMNVAAA